MNDKDHNGDIGDVLELDLFEGRVRRYQTPLFAYLGRFGFQTHVTEELAQESFLRAWRSRHQYDERKSQYATWLFRIARNVALTEYDKQCRTLVKPDMERVDEASTHYDGEHALTDLQKIERLHRAMKRLSVDDQEVIAMSGIEELDHKEAASVLDCSIGKCFGADG